MDDDADRRLRASEPGVVRRVLGPIGDDLAHPSRWPAFEGLRGVASVAVVAYHLLRVLAPEREWSEALPAALWWTAGGRLGVDVFFVLSGFLVVQSWESTRSRARSLGHAVRDFASRRIGRVFPAYWLSLLVFVPTVGRELLSVEHLGDLGLLATGQAYWRPELTNQVNTVYWTLTTETDFYLVAGLVAVAVRRRSTAVAVTVAAMALATTWVHGDLPWLRGDLPAGHLGGRLDQFVVGAVAGAAVVGGSGWIRVVARRGVGWLLAALVLGLCQWHGATLFSGQADWNTAAFHSVFAVVVAAVVVRIAQSPPRWLCHGAARGPGQVSYSLYLFHFPILVWALDLADARGRGYRADAGLVAAVVGSVSMIAVVTVASYLLVERRALVRRARRAPVPAGPTATGSP